MTTRRRLAKRTLGQRILAGMGYGDQATEKRLDRVTAALYSRWRGMAQELPKRFREPYIRAMQINRHGDHVEFSLQPQPGEETLVRSAEYGFGPGGVGTSGPYDMRMTLLRPSTKSVRRNKSGQLYLSVPIRVTTRRMRSYPGGNEAYRQARQLSATLKTDQGTMWGGALPRGLTPKIRPEGRQVPGIGYVPPHATDPTAGLRRFHGPKGNTYGVFRTISQAGKPWVHPGVKARRFIRRLAAQVQAVIKEVG